jgi:hypothetical protein
MATILHNGLRNRDVVGTQDRSFYAHARGDGMCGTTQKYEQGTQGQGDKSSMGTLGLNTTDISNAITRYP